MRLGAINEHETSSASFRAQRHHLAWRRWHAHWPRGETIARTDPPRAGWKRAWGILILIIGMQVRTYPE